MATRSRDKRRDRAGGRTGGQVIEVRLGVDAVRTIRMAIMQVAYDLAKDRNTAGYVLLVDSKVTEDRVRREWETAAGVLKPEILSRLVVCLARNGTYCGIPRDPPEHVQGMLHEAVAKARSGIHSRIDYSFVVQKVLLHKWLTARESVTAEWLGRTVGCSYPTVARAIDELGSLVQRTTDRRISLTHFPQEQFSRLVAIAAKARSTARFSDRSGQPRSMEAHVRRLQKLAPPHLAIGGAIGARHWVPELDLVGTPRLDVSIHCPQGRPDPAFIEALDPALKRERDPLKPANVVVHVVRHADPLFARREAGLFWADEVECLFDLYDARLDAQASQFLKALLGKTGS